jgi:PAS domain S-box-containing protein
MKEKNIEIFKSNDQFRSLFEHSHDAMIISNSDKEILLANTAAEVMFGYEKSQLIGINIAKLMPVDRRNNYDRDLKEVMKGRIVTNRDNRLEFLGLKHDGTVFPIELTFNGWKSNDTQYFNSQIRDISERKSYEYDLQISNRALLVMSECNKALVNAVEEKQYFQDICNLLVDYGGYKVAWIGLVKYDETQSVEPIAYKGYEKGHFENEIIAKGRMTWKMRENNNTGPSARAVNTKKEMFCNNIQTDPKYDFWRKDAKKIGYNSQISIPLIVDDKVNAVLVILSEDPEAYYKEEVKFLRELSNDMSFGIKSLKLKQAQSVVEEHLKDNEGRLLLSNKYLQIMSQSNKILVKSKTVKEYLENICKIIVMTGGHVKSLVQRINYRESVTIDDLGMYGNFEGEYVEEQFLSQNVKITGLTANCVRENRPIVYQNIKGTGNFIYWNEDPDKIKFQFR